MSEPHNEGTPPYRPPEPPSIVQFNVSKMRFPWTDERFDTFRELLPHIHAEAEEHAGFVDRCKGEEWKAGYIAPYVGFRAAKIDGVDQDLIMGNLSRWTTRKALHEFVYTNPVHVEVFRRRKEWFLPWSKGTRYHVMWHFDPNSHTDLENPIPLAANDTITEATIRLAALNRYGPNARHFDWSYEF